MPYANLNIGLTPAKRKALISQIAALQASMPYLVNLTPKEKINYLRMGKKAPTFINAALELAKQNPNILPPYFDMPGFTADVQDHQFLGDALVQINSLQQAVANTVIALEQESIRTALDFYKHCQAASTQNIPGAGATLAQLQPMMPKTGKKKKKKE
jgi:hypothetical protein